MSRYLIQICSLDLKMSSDKNYHRSAKKVNTYEIQKLVSDTPQVLLAMDCAVSHKSWLTQSVNTLQTEMLATDKNNSKYKTISAKERT